MYAAVAGLKTHMQALNVIGNNVANVNTNGYKSGRYVFQSALYNSLRGGSNGSTTVGGKNPSQIGYGASVSTVDINMSTGQYSPTGKSSDCMIDGDGFFLVGQKGMTFESPQDFKSLTLTRVGDIEFKADGYLCKPDGNVVYGFKCLGYAADGETPVVDNALQELCKPKITADGRVVYSEDQYKKMQGIDDDTTTPPAGDDTDTQVWPPYSELPFAEFDSITIDEGTGKVSGMIKDTSETVTVGFIAIGNVTNPNGVSQLTGTYYHCGDGAGEMSISILGGGASQIYDSDKCTFEARHEVTDDTTDPATTYILPDQWVLNGSGGLNKTDADYASKLQALMDAARLTHVNGSGTTAADGAADADNAVTPSDGMIIHTGGTTGLLTSGLEMTDVDLATEISNMILIQRGYQANTRIITVTDSMLEELVNMKR